MYFDAVLDDSMRPVFNGTPAEVESWLFENTTKHNERLRVCIGKTMQVVPALEYLDVTSIRRS